MTEGDEKIKVFRVLVYEGTRSNVEKVLDRRHAQPLYIAQMCTIAELLCTELPVGTLIGVPLGAPKTKFARELEEDLGPRRLPWQKEKK